MRLKLKTFENLGGGQIPQVFIFAIFAAKFRIIGRAKSASHGLPVLLVRLRASRSVICRGAAFPFQKLSGIASNAHNTVLSYCRN